MEPGSLEYDDMESDSLEYDDMESDGLEYDDMATEDLPHLSKCPVNDGIRGLSDSDIQLICSPDLVKFLIGPSKKEYYLSKPLVASLSESLHFILSAHHYNPDGVDPINLNWCNFIDEDIFNLFVQYAYTGRYNIPMGWVSLNHEKKVLRKHREYSEARSTAPHAYSIYESSPFVETPCPASPYRRHAQVWAFAKSFDIHGLEEKASDWLRVTLEVDMRSSTRSGSYLGLEEGKCREVVDVIGHVYHQGRRFWGNEIQGGAPLSGMRLTVARFAHFIEDSRDGQHGPEYQERNYRKFGMWMDLLEREPQIAVDMDRLNTER